MLGRAFRSAGAAIIALGVNRGELGASEYVKSVLGHVRGVPPLLDLELERAVQALIVELSSAGLVQSAHDCSDGGLAVTLAECCFDTGGVGAIVDVPATRMAEDANIDSAATLFGESASRIIVTVAAPAVPEVLSRAQAAKVPVEMIGSTGGSVLRLAVSGRLVVEVAVSEIESIWARGLERHFAERAA